MAHQHYRLFNVKIIHLCMFDCNNYFQCLIAFFQILSIMICLHTDNFKYSYLILIICMQEYLKLDN